MGGKAFDKDRIVDDIRDIPWHDFVRYLSWKIAKQRLPRSQIEDDSDLPGPYTSKSLKWIQSFVDTCVGLYNQSNKQQLNSEEVLMILFKWLDADERDYKRAKMIDR